MSKKSWDKFPPLAIGSLIAALYVGLSPRIFPALYNSRIFKPYRYPQGNWDITKLAGVEKEDVFFQAKDGSKLHGWFFHQPQSEHVVLFNHGNTGNLTGRIQLLELLLSTGLTVFVYDYRGYGRSEGAPSTRGVCEDGVTAFDFLVRELGYKPTQIVLYGESLGTAIAAEVASQRTCAAVILQSGFTSLRKIGHHHLPLTRVFPRFLFPKSTFETAELMSKVRWPLLILHGLKDPVVPFAHAEEMFEKAAGPKTMVKLDGCHHNDLWSVSPETYVESVRNFVGSLSKDASTAPS